MFRIYKKYMSGYINYDLEWEFKVMSLLYDINCYK